MASGYRLGRRLRSSRRDRLDFLTYLATLPKGDPAPSPDPHTGNPVPPYIYGLLPIISGDPRVGKELTLMRGDWSSGGLTNNYSYQWLANGEEIPGATDLTYTLQSSDLNDIVTARVTATNALGSTSAISNGFTILAATAPINRTVPVISGTPAVDNGIASSGGIWIDGGQPIISYAYQWQADGFEIEGATDLSFTPTNAELRRRLLIEVSATNAIGTTSVLSDMTNKVSPPPGPPINYDDPMIGGLARVGGTLSVSVGEWNELFAPTFQYQWIANGVDIPGENLETLAVTSDYLGQMISCRLIAVNIYGQKILSLNEVGPIVAADQPAIITPPHVVTNPDGSTEVVGGDYDGMVSGGEITYEWYDDDGNPIPDADGPDYAGISPPPGGVTITIPAPEGETPTVIDLPYSPPTPEVDLPLNVGFPSLTGGGRSNALLTLDPGLWDARGLALTIEYEWVYSNGSGVAGQSSSDLTYQATSPLDDWKVINVLITATNANGSVTISTNTSGTMRPPIVIPTIKRYPRITGTPRVGNMLVVNTGDWDDGDYGEAELTFSYKWYADGVEVTGNSYMLDLVADHVGKIITVEVTATNSVGSGMVETDPTAPIAAFAAFPVIDTDPVLSGTAEVGELLSLTNGTWNDGGNTITGYSYAWYRGKIIIPNADQSTYTIVRDDVGYKIKGLVIAENIGGKGSAFSNETIAIPDEAPINLTLPIVTGPTVAGQTLAVTNGTWETPGTDITRFDYQWLADGTPIAGADKSTYNSVSGDIGKQISCTVTAVHPTGNVSVTSDETYPIDASFTPPINLVIPALSYDQLRVSFDVESNTGTWRTNGQEITEYQYQWRRDGAAISGATSDTYTLTETDLGANMSCTVTAVNASGATPATSIAVGPVMVNTDDATLAYVAAMSVPPSPERVAVIDTLVKSLKNSGVYAKLDILALFAAHDEQAGRLNLVNPAKSFTNINSCPFTEDEGFAGDSVAVNDRYLQYADPMNSLTYFSQTSALMGVWSLTDTMSWPSPALRYLFAGTGQPNFLWHLGLNTTSGAWAVINAGTSSTPSVPSGGNHRGLLLLNRTGLTTAAFYRNTTKVTDTNTSESVQPQSGPMRVFTTDIDDNACNYKAGVAVVGGGLTTQEIEDLHSALMAYLVAVGAESV